VAEPARQALAVVETVPLRSQRYGNYDIPVDRVLSFPDGLIGFAEAHRFAVLDSSRPESPFSCLVCLDFPELGFVVCDPTRLWPGYTADLPAPEEGSVEDRAVLAIVTVPRDARGMTVNLMGPLVIDCVSRQGRQVILDTGRYSTRHALLAG
jgi:flagellar assembly factor FliW